MGLKSTRYSLATSTSSNTRAYTYYTIIELHSYPLKVLSMHIKYFLIVFKHTVDKLEGVVLYLRELIYTGEFSF